MATSAGQGWAQLRQQARSLESQVSGRSWPGTDGFAEGRSLVRSRADRPPQTETSLQTYSQFSSQTSIPPKPTEEEKNAEAKVQELLDKASKKTKPYAKQFIPV